jgi:deoxyribodipyrimidine photolyase-related protein
MRSYFVGPWELSQATAVLPATPRDGRILMADSLGKGSALPYHRKKLVLVLSALRHFRDELRAQGFEVDHRAAPSYADAIVAHAAEHRPSEVVVQQPAEWGIAQSLAQETLGARLAEHGVKLTLADDRRFLTPRAEFARWANGRKLLRMEDFYRWQRRRLGVLVDGNGDPLGGTWNLDRANRESARALKAHGVPPAPRAFPPDTLTRKVIALVDTMPDHWGDTQDFDLPVTRAEALTALDDFLDHRLAAFGPYEDAMLRGEAYLYHSRLSAALNIGLLHPREIVDAVIARHLPRRANPDAPPLQSVEGFIRQIIGWREYVNGLYWLHMPAYRERNYFGFTRPLPQAYWHPEQTDLVCLADSVRMVRDTAYAHHIHRLMILCNFATLAGVNPLRLSEWFWAGFADAFEWVELPNVVGMGTFGDGGLLGSKPYVSSAAYVNRMSDYCGQCRFDPKARTGDRACPFNYMYWTFLDDVRRRGLDVGARMALVLKQLERIPARELAEMRRLRDAFVEALEPDSTGWSFYYDQG